MHLFLKILSGMANSVDPDQTAPSGAVWSGSALFAYVILSETLVFEFLGHLLYNTGCIKRKSVFENAQNVLINTILCMPKVSSPLIHFIVSNNSGSRKWRRQSDCADGRQIWAFAFHTCLKTHFRMVWPI